MKNWTRRDVLKSGVALPAAAAIGGSGLGAASTQAAGARRRLQGERASDRSAAIATCSISAGDSTSATPATPPRTSASAAAGREGSRRRATSSRRATSPSTTATGSRWTCRTTGRSACRSRTTRPCRARASTRSDATTRRPAWAGTAACSSCPPTDAGRRDLDRVRRRLPRHDGRLQRLLHRPSQRRLRPVQLRRHRLRTARRARTCCWSASMRRSATAGSTRAPASTATCGW